jgi:tetratricopeptide (TPR) repeat protein
MYVALLISSFFIYAEGVFLQEFLFKHFTVSSSLRVVIHVFSSLDTYPYILLLYFFLAIGYWALTLRNKIILGDIVGDENFRKKYSDTPLQNLLAYELYYIDKLSREVDNQRPISTTVPVESKLNITASVDFNQDFYSNLVTSDSKIQLGSYIQIPVNVIIAFFGRFIESKKIQGNALFTENEIVIVVSLTGDKKPLIWEVRHPYSPKKPDEKDGKPGFQDEKGDDQNAVNADKKNTGATAPSSSGLALEEIIKGMMKELAYRIFTDLTQFNSYRWEATKHFMAGLENYRSCLVTPRDQLSMLKNAEDEFIAAITEDSSFGMAWYNLGVVYTERGFFDAADNAFIRCISQEKNRWQAYYALALNTNRRSKDPKTSMLLKAAEWCYHAEKINKNIHKKNPNLKRFPEILRFKGQIYRTLYQPGPDWSDSQDRKYFEKSRDSFEKALELYYCHGVKPRALSYVKKLVLQHQELSSEVDEKKNLIDLLGDFGWLYIIDACIAQRPEDRDASLEIALKLFSESIPYRKRSTQKSDIQGSALFEVVAQGTVSPCFLWKYGFLHMARGDCITAKDLFCETMALKPQDFLFNISYELASLLCNPAITDDELPSFWKEAIQFVRKPFDPEKGPVPEDNTFYATWYHIKHLWHAVPLFSTCDIKGKNSLSAVTIRSNPFSSELKEPFFSVQKDNSGLKCEIFGKYLLTLYSLFEIVQLLENKIFIPDIVNNHLPGFQSGDIENSIINAVTGKLRKKEPTDSTDTEKSVIKEVIIKLRQKVPDSENIEKPVIRDVIVQLRDNEPDLEKRYVEELIIKKVTARLRETISREIVPKDNQLLGYLDSHTDWILGHVCCEIGKIHYNNLKDHQALDAFERAQGYFRGYPLELRKQSVENVLAELHRRLNHIDKALILAWQAHWHNPTDESVHQRIGRCEFEVFDYQNAIKAWDDARLWDPKFWYNSFYIAAYYWTWIRDLRNDRNVDRGTRKNYLQRAIESLTKSLCIAEEEFQKLNDRGYEPYNKYILNRLLTQYFFMGICHMDNENYADAIYHLRILKNLGKACDTDQEKDPEKVKKIVKQNETARLLPDMFYLSACLSKQGKYDLANIENYEILNTESIKPVHEKIKNIHQDDFPPDVKEELKKECATDCGQDLHIVEFTIRDILHGTYLALAQNSIECSCKPDEIRTWLNNATKLLEKIPLKLPDGTSNRRMNITEKKRGYRGQIEKIEGLYHLKTLQDTEESIRHLKVSTCLNPDSESFIFLLMALYQKLRIQKTKRRDLSLLAVFKDNYRTLKKMGIPEEYYDDVTSMYNELIACRKSPSAKGDDKEQTADDSRKA